MYAATSHGRSTRLRGNYKVWLGGACRALLDGRFQTYASEAIPKFFGATAT